MYTIQRGLVSLDKLKMSSLLYMCEAVSPRHFRWIDSLHSSYGRNHTLDVCMDYSDYSCRNIEQIIPVGIPFFGEPMQISATALPGVEATRN